MFDFGFSELVVIGVVMLIVVGPERLPKVARTAGHLLGRVQRYVSDVKSDINREMQLDELKKLQEEARKSAMAFESSVRSEMASVESSVNASVASASSAVAELESSLKSPADPAPGPRSITWSAMAIVSGLCSTTSTVLPLSRNRSSRSFIRAMSCGCRPTVGSSNT